MIGEKLVGIELVEKDLDLVEGELIGKAAVKHVGKIGFLKVTVEGGISALPLINAGIDFLEAKIPGDQKIMASSLKGIIAGIKFKI